MLVIVMAGRGLRVVRLAAAPAGLIGGDASLKATGFSPWHNPLACSALHHHMHRD
jgi:hypothetical protein